MNLIEKLVNSGVHEGLSISVSKRVRMFNRFCVFFIIFSAFYAWINYSLHNVAMFLNLGSIALASIAFSLAHFGKYIAAIFMLMATTLIVGLCSSLLFGRYIATELIFCAGIAYSIAMFDHLSRIIFGIVLNIFCYVFILYMYENYSPYYVTAVDEIRVFYYFNVIVFLFSLCILVYFLKQENLRTERILRQNNRDLQLSRKKAENLLLNILPAEIARELQENGYVEPRFHENVTVLFTDFHGFTKVAEKMRPLELVSELDIYFSAFDLIAEKHGIEKLKTMGDAFMCAGGLISSDPDHAKRTVIAAIEMRDFVKSIKQKREENGERAWDVRIGIHTGPLVSGIIGQKKFAFDIWGDTVNIASRMETSSEPGEINISSATYELVKENFATTYRGKFAPKNKGELDMYFVEKQLT